MKRHHLLSALFASVFLLTSCAAPAAPTSTPEPPPTVAPTADPMPVVEAFLAAHNAHDNEAAGALMTDEVMFALPIRVQRHLHTEPIVGKEEVTAYLVSDAWAAITIEGSNFQVEGNRVLFNCKIFSNGSLLGSGTISSNSACLLVVENDLITFIGDQAEALLFLGD